MFGVTRNSDERSENSCKQERCFIGTGSEDEKREHRLGLAEKKCSVVTVAYYNTIKVAKVACKRRLLSNLTSYFL